MAVILSSGAPIVAAQEIGAPQLADLLAALPGWQGRKAKGLNGNGLNAVLCAPDWALEGEPYDYNLPSYGQMQRTLIVCRLANGGLTVEVGSTHFAAAASDLTKAEANAAKFAQVRYVDGLLAGRSVVVGADLARADDDDDLAYLSERGWSLNSRTAATPQLTFSRGVAVGSSERVPTGKACDHEAVLTRFTLRA